MGDRKGIHPVKNPDSAIPNFSFGCLLGTDQTCSNLWKNKPVNVSYFDWCLTAISR